MAIKYTYDKEKKALFVSIDGVFSLEDFEFTIKEIVNSKDYPPDIRTLWDMRNANFESIDSEFEKHAIQVRSRFPERGNAKISMVADSALSFGMSRMYEILSDNLPQKIKVFKNYSEAEAWLLSDEQI